MMKANELRKDNLLLYDGKIVFIAEILKDNLVTIYNGSGLEKGTTLGCLRPIPLTEEILLKCGFEQVDDMCYHPDMKIRSLYINTFILRKNTCSNLFEFHFQHKNLPMFENVEVKSLHQLQNLFFALTSGELNIKL